MACLVLSSLELPKAKARHPLTCPTLVMIVIEYCDCYSYCYGSTSGDRGPGLSVRLWQWPASTSWLPLLRTTVSDLIMRPPVLHKVLNKDPIVFGFRTRGVLIEILHYLRGFGEGRRSTCFGPADSFKIHGGFGREAAAQRFLMYPGGIIANTWSHVLHLAIVSDMYLKYASNDTGHPRPSEHPRLD